MRLLAIKSDNMNKIYKNSFISYFSDHISSFGLSFLFASTLSKYLGGFPFYDI